jgi:hypothetical protein
MRDSIKLEDMVLTSEHGDETVIGFYLAPTGHTYIKTLNESNRCTTNYIYEGFQNFLEKNSLKVKPKSELAV